MITHTCGRGGIGRHAGFRFQWETMQVRVLSPAPRRKKAAPFRFRGFLTEPRKLHICSLLPPSPHATRCAGLARGPHVPALAVGIFFARPFHVGASSVRLRNGSRFQRLPFLRLYSAAPPFPHATRCAGLARGPRLKNATRKPGGYFCGITDVNAAAGVYGDIGSRQRNRLGDLKSFLLPFSRVKR